jgi:hypothetical protein
LKPVQANSSREPISKTTRAKWIEGMAQAAEYLLCKCEALISNNTQEKEKEKKEICMSISIALLFIVRKQTI